MDKKSYDSPSARKNSVHISRISKHTTGVTTGSSSASSPARDDCTEKQKVCAISEAMKTEPKDVTTLRQLSISRGGLLTDELRKQAWPVLLDVDMDTIPNKPDETTLHGHRDFEQVVLDVNRTLKRFPPGMDEDLRLSLQDQLVDVIMWILIHKPQLHYYQGYHDVCVTFLLVVGEERTFALMDKLSTNHFRDFMYETMDKTKHMLNYLFPIIEKANPQLKLYMEKSEVGAVFALPWLITWYGHVLDDVRHIVRLYDFFVASHPLMPIYLGAAIVLYREHEVLAQECEMCYIHSLLAKMPPNLPFEYLIRRAGDLFVQYPPKELETEVLLQSKRAALLEHNISESSIVQERMQERRATQLRNSRKWNSKSHSLFFQMTLWTITAAVGAAAFALLKRNTNWDFWVWT